MNTNHKMKLNNKTRSVQEPVCNLLESEIDIATTEPVRFDMARAQTTRSMQRSSAQWHTRRGMPMPHAGKSKTGHGLGFCLLVEG